MNRLTRIANKFDSDKGNRVRDRHNYARVYHEAFAPYVGRRIVMLELGVLHPYGKHVSTKIWQEYFGPAADVRGFDLVALEGMTQGDSGNREDLARLGDGPFDIVIDDASHASQDQQAALGWFASRMAPGGVYCIEDLHWRPVWSKNPHTRAVLDRARAGNGWHSPFIEDLEDEMLAARVEGIDYFDSMRPGCALENHEALALIWF